MRVINRIKITKKKQTMKKNLFKTRLLSFVAFGVLALAFASCANEDVAQSTTGTETDNDKNLTTFVAGDEAKTRTSMDYTSGNFYWEAGDKIYVKDDDGTWQVSSNAPTSKVASFQFKVPGKFNNSTTYKVYYPGKNGSNDQVTIPAAQTQATPNTTTHFGESGDCGTADATGTAGGGVFSFSLDHQAAILVFQPYTSNIVLKDCYLTKIEVNSDNDITHTYTLNSTTGELTGTGTGKQITLTTQGTGSYANGFPLTNSAVNMATNGAYMLIKPGTHKLKVRYWVKDIVTNVEGTITKTLPSYNYAKNTYYDMTASLDAKNYDSNYCLWDAQKPFWYGHEWNAPNPADRWQPLVSVKPFPHASELVNPTDVRAASTAFPGQGVRNDAVNLCKDCPNANEIAWYAEKGDPRFDADQIWTTMGHLYKGGFWLKKKSKMALDNSTTVANIESMGPDGTDWCTSSTSKTVTKTYSITTLPSATEAVNYFFVPSIGYGLGLSGFEEFTMNGTLGVFWSLSGCAESAGNASAYSFHLNYYNSQIYASVISNYSRTSNICYPLKFE